MNRSLSTTVLVAVLVACVAAALLRLQFGYQEMGVVSLSIVPVLLVVVAITTLDDRDLFSPLYLLLYLLIVSVFLKTVHLSYFDSGRARAVSLDSRDLDILFRGLGGMICAVMAFVAGYVIVLRETARSRRALTVRLDTRYARGAYNTGGYFMFLLGTLAVSLACLSLFAANLDLVSQVARGIVSAKRIHQETVGGSSRGSAFGYLRWGAVTLPQVVTLMTVSAAMTQRVRMSGRVKILVSLLGLVSIVIPVLTSTRLEMMYLFLMLGMLYHYNVRRFRPRTIVVLATTLILVTGLLGEARFAQTAQRGGGVSLVSMFDRTVGSAYFIDVAKTSVIMDTIPDEVDYLYGSSFTLFLLAPIPRTLWPEKPSVRISTFVGDVIYNRPDRSGIPPGFIAEAYMNFGFLGIIALLGLTGWACGRLYRGFLLRMRSPTTTIGYVFVIVIIMFTLLTGDFTILVSQGVRYGAVFLVVRAFLGRRRRVLGSRRVVRRASA